MNIQKIPPLPSAVSAAETDREHVDGLFSLLASGRILPWRSLEGVSSSALSERSYLTRELADAILASFGTKAPAWGDAWMAVLCGLSRQSRLNPRREIKLPCTFRAWFRLAPTIVLVGEIPLQHSPHAEHGYLFALANGIPTL